MNSSQFYCGVKNEEGDRLEGETPCPLPSEKKVLSLLIPRSSAAGRFIRAIVDATSDLVCAFKPQIAFYSAVWAERDILLTIDHIHENHPGIPDIRRRESFVLGKGRVERGQL